MPTDKFPHDASYKAIFSDKAMVKSLLLEFIPDAFVKEFDFDSLTPHSNTYSADGLSERRNDMVWKLRWRGVWCYIYIMLEFQSSQDHWMALRMLTYTALLWEGLVSNGDIKAGEPLPPVFPIVLYNGDSPWNASVELANLIHSVDAAINGYQPTYKYFVLDEKRVPSAYLKQCTGGASFIIRTEQAKTSAEIVDIAVRFDTEIGADESSIARISVLEWMDRKIRHLTRKNEENEGSLHNQEVNMLAELIDKYKKPYVEEGRASGLAEGRAEGMRHIVKNMLSTRFGTVPETWEKVIAKVGDDSLLKISNTVYTVKSRDEFDAFLRSLAN